MWRNKVGIRNSNLDERAYINLESKRSGELGKKVYMRYNRGLKYLFQRHNREIISVIERKSLSSSTRLLEIGCGFGDFLLEANKLIKNIVGVDLSFEQLVLASKYSSLHNKILAAEGSKLPFSNCSFDFVVMKGVVHHLRAPKNVFREVKRVLKAKGVLIIFEGNPCCLYRKIVLSLADILNIKHESSLFPHLSGREIADILNQQEFETKIFHISGLFAPLGLLGIGTRKIWYFLNRIDGCLNNISFFGWYNLIIATLTK